LLNFTRSATPAAAAGSDKFHGGLIVVGSYVPKSTIQLEHLLTTMNVFPLEIPAHDIIHILREYSLNETDNNNKKTSDEHDDNNHDQHHRQRLFDHILQHHHGLSTLFHHLLQSLESNIHQNIDTVLFTSRLFVNNASIEETSFVSYFITSLIHQLNHSPAFLIAKGGITSHEIAQYSLQMKSGRVLGQIDPGVPVWQADKTSKFPDIKYIVFPGNVGDEFALSRVAERLGVQLKIEKNIVVQFEKNQENERYYQMKDHTKLMHQVLVNARTNARALGAFNVCKFLSFLKPNHPIVHIVC
jgi:hypothetical protein